MPSRAVIIIKHLLQSIFNRFNASKIQDMQDAIIIQHRLYKQQRHSFPNKSIYLFLKKTGENFISYLYAKKYQNNINFITGILSLNQIQA